MRRPSNAVLTNFSYSMNACQVSGVRKLVLPVTRRPLYPRSEEHTSELQSPCNIVCRLLLEKKSTPKVQAQQALFFGETPVNSKACAQMEALQAGSCAQYHANEAGAYLQTIHFLETPVATGP